MKRSRPVLRQVASASVPVWSIGFLSCVPFLASAVINRRKRDWARFAVYLAATIALITDVTAAREQLGRFSSADELSAYTQLSPDRVDELRDLMIFT